MLYIPHGRVKNTENLKKMEMAGYRRFEKSYIPLLAEMAIEIPAKAGWLVNWTETRMGKLP